MVPHRRPGERQGEAVAKRVREGLAEHRAGGETPGCGSLLRATRGVPHHAGSGNGEEKPVTVPVRVCETLQGIFRHHSLRAAACHGTAACHALPDAGDCGPGHPCARHRADMAHPHRGADYCCGQDSHGLHTPMAAAACGDAHKHNPEG